MQNSSFRFHVSGSILALCLWAQATIAAHYRVYGGVDAFSTNMINVGVGQDPTDGVNFGQMNASNDVQDAAIDLKQDQLSGTNVIFVASVGSSEAGQLENGTNLVAAIAEAHARAPTSEVQRVTILVAPGTYVIEQDITISSSYIDLIGQVAVNPIVKLDRGCMPSGSRPPAVLTGRDLYNHFIRFTGSGSTFGNFSVAGLSLSIAEGVARAGNSAYNLYVSNPDSDSLELDTYWNSNGTYRNIVAETSSDGCFYSGTSGFYSGIYTEVSGAFGGAHDYGDMGGTFQNCVGGDQSFGYEQAGMTATIQNCTAGEWSFGAAWGGVVGGAEISGTFNSCTAGDNSFGSTVNATPGEGKQQVLVGAYINCIGGNNSFGCGSLIDTATMTDCYAGDNSFGSCSWDIDTIGEGGIGTNAVLLRCEGGASSFGLGTVATQGKADGDFRYCISPATSGLNDGATMSGTTNFCITK